MNCAPFPIEIFEHILDNLADVAPDVTNTDREKALRACSLVCKAFVSMCRRHLFRDINISFYPRQGINVSRSRLLELLEKYPAIPSYVRGVTYTFHSTRSPQPTLQRKKAGKSGNYLPDYADGHSRSLYESFPDIRTLCLRHGPSAQPHECTYHREFDKRQRFALYHCILQDFACSPTHDVTTLTICDLTMGLLDFLIFPSLQSLVLVNVRWLPMSDITQKTLFQLEPPSKIARITVKSGEPFPVDILRFLPNLVHFDVGGLDLLSSNEVWPIFFTRYDYNKKIVVYNNLKHVEIGDACCFVLLCDVADSDNTPKCAFPALHSLKIILASPNISWTRSDRDSIYTLLRHSPNLKQLEILGLDAQPAALSPQLDHHIVRYGTALEHLRLEYANPDELAIFPHSVLAIRNALSSLEENNHLKRLGLDLCADIGQVQEWFRTFSEAWESVDRMLGGHGFPYFEEFRVSLAIVCDDRPRVVGWDVVEVPEIHEFDSEETIWGLWAGCLMSLHSNSRVTRRYDPNFNFKYSSAKSQCYQLEFLRL